MIPFYLSETKYIFFLRSFLGLFVILKHLYNFGDITIFSFKWILNYVSTDLFTVPNFISTNIHSSVSIKQFANLLKGRNLSILYLNPYESSW